MSRKALWLERRLKTGEQVPMGDTYSCLNIVALHPLEGKKLPVFVEKVIPALKWVLRFVMFYLESHCSCWTSKYKYGMLTENTMTDIVYIFLMKDRGDLPIIPLISDSALLYLSESGLGVQVYDCDIFVVLSDFPEDTGWDFKEQHKFTVVPQIVWHIWLFKAQLPGKLK